MKKDALHDVEKPYAFRYPVPGAVQTNMEMEEVGGIQVADIRSRDDDLCFQSDGFTVLKLPQDFPYETYFDDKGLLLYFDAVESLLKEFLGASEVRVFRHGVRKRHPDFPSSTGESYEYDQPTSVAHVGQSDAK